MMRKGLLLKMTGKEFLNKVSHGKGDFLQSLIDLLQAQKISYCIIGGLAVNAYAEPVVSLDLDVIIVSDQLEKLLPALKTHGTIEKFAHSLNISAASSDLRVQIQTDPRYQVFLKRSSAKDVLGYQIPVASIEDVFQGKLWAAQDPSRRASKRQKDLADILRLIEAKPSLASLVPESLQKQLSL